MNRAIFFSSNDILYHGSWFLFLSPSEVRQCIKVSFAVNIGSGARAKLCFVPARVFRKTSENEHISKISWTFLIDDRSISTDNP